MFRFLFLGFVLLNNACSQLSFQKVGYFIVHNIGELQCQKAMTNGCASRADYADYQRQRKEITEQGD